MGVSREHNLALGVTNNIGLCPKLPGRFGSRLGNIDMIIVKISHAAWPQQQDSELFAEMLHDLKHILLLL